MHCITFEKTANYSNMCVNTQNTRICINICACVLLNNTLSSLSLICLLSFLQFLLTVLCLKFFLLYYVDYCKCGEIKNP